MITTPYINLYSYLLKNLWFVVNPHMLILLFMANILICIYIQAHSNPQLDYFTTDICLILHTIISTIVYTFFGLDYINELSGIVLLLICCTNAATLLFYIIALSEYKRPNKTIDDIEDSLLNSNIRMLVVFFIIFFLF